MKIFLSIALLVGTLAFSGCGDSDEFVGIKLTTPNPVPICAYKAYTGSSNQPWTVNTATGVLANDTPNGATLTFQATSANGGTIVGAQDESFIYTPRLELSKPTIPVVRSETLEVWRPAQRPSP